MNLLKSYRLELDHVTFALLALSNFLLSYYLGSDFYWHLKAGELLSQTGSIPHGDPFSFTFFGEHWVMHEWLFEYLLYQLHSYTGIYGVKLFTAIISTSAVFIAYRSAVALSQNKWLSLIIAAGLIFIFYNFSFSRPQLFTYLFLSVYVYILLGYKYRAYPVRLYWLPIIMIAWVNMHGGYIIGIVLLALFIISELFERLFYTSSEVTEDEKFRPVIIVTVLCILASLFNPYTYHQWIYPFQVASMTSNYYINEWKSPNFQIGHYKIYLFFIFLYFFVRIISPARPKAAEVIIPLTFIMLSFISRRHIPIAILVLIPFYAQAFQQTLSSFKLPARIPILERRNITNTNFAFNKNFQSKYSYILNYLLLLIILSGSYLLHNSFANRIKLYEEDNKPVAAVEFIKSAGIKGNVFGNYDYGGYLIYRLYPESKVFIDSRTDLYGDKFFKEYLTIIRAEKDWKQLINKYDIDYILIRNDQALATKLAEINKFILIYRDYFNCVYVKNSDKFNPIIEHYGNKYIAPKHD